MFYLLEDNKIIDSKDYYKYVSGCDRNGKMHYIVDIKKQSENVLDLIEVGDLIKCERCDGVFEVSDINLFDKEDKEIYACDKSFISYPAGAEHLENEISAIYKLDEKGNYIKVWEEKDA